MNAVEHFRVLCPRLCFVALFGVLGSSQAQSPGLLRLASVGGPSHALQERDLLSLPQATLRTRTAWTDGVQTFEGPLLRDVLGLLNEPLARSKSLTASALNDYAVRFPAEDAWRWDVLVALRMNGAPIPRAEKGPLWIVYPRDQHVQLQESRYDHRWVWQLRALELHQALD